MCGCVYIMWRPGAYQSTEYAIQFAVCGVHNLSFFQAVFVR
jgi:hypothetical protein